MAFVLPNETPNVSPSSRNLLSPESIQIWNATLRDALAEIYEAINFRTLQSVPKSTIRPHHRRKLSALLKRRGLSKPLLGTSETFYRCSITPISGYLRNQRKYIKLQVRREERTLPFIPFISLLSTK